jgi:alpha-ketoglutarate-dependent taurine dioxygenase
MKQTSVAGDFGALIELSHDELLGLEPSDILNLLLDKGVIILRGANPGLEEFKELTERLATQFLANPNTARRLVHDGGKTTGVTPGQGDVGPHSEVSYLRFRPELLSFMVVRPARSGGESLFWDGYALWDRMPEHLKRQFEAKQIVYRIELPLRYLHAVFGPLTEEQLLARLAGHGLTDICPAGDSGYAATSVVPATSRCPRSGRIAFSNSVSVMPVEFDDGSELSALARAELMELCLDAELVVPGQPFDIILIDNTRVMHGRKAFDDPHRELVTRLAMRLRHRQA